MAVVIHISTGSAVPIYRQITDQVRLGLASGQFASGEQLPSVRSLAEELVVNVNTVAKAYADLSREGLIESRQGKGVFIAERRRMYTKQERSRRLEPALRALLSEAAALGFGARELLEIVEGELGKWEPGPGGRQKGGSSNE